MGRDFVSDAFAHCKSIGNQLIASDLFTAVGLSDRLDDEVMPLNDDGSVEGFLGTGSALRLLATAGDVRLRSTNGEAKGPGVVAYLSETDASQN